MAVQGMNQGFDPNMMALLQQQQNGLNGQGQGQNSQRQQSQGFDLGYNADPYAGNASSTGAYDFSSGFPIGQGPQQNTSGTGQFDAQSLGLDLNNFSLTGPAEDTFNINSFAELQEFAPTTAQITSDQTQNMYMSPPTPGNVQKPDYSYGLPANASFSAPAYYPNQQAGSRLSLMA